MYLTLTDLAPVLPYMIYWASAAAALACGGIMLILSLGSSYLTMRIAARTNAIIFGVYLAVAVGLDSVMSLGLEAGFLIILVAIEGLFVFCGEIVPRIFFAEYEAEIDMAMEEAMRE